VGCSSDRSLERKGKGRWGGHGGTYSHVRERGWGPWARPRGGGKRKGVRAWKRVVGRRRGHATVRRRRQPEGGGAGSRKGEGGEGREGAGRWAPPISKRS
jgi:hypothetical protein